MIVLTGRVENSRCFLGVRKKSRTRLELLEEEDDLLLSPRKG